MADGIRIRKRHVLTSHPIVKKGIIPIIKSGLSRRSCENPNDIREIDSVPGDQETFSGPAAGFPLFVKSGSSLLSKTEFQIGAGFFKKIGHW